MMMKAAMAPQEKVVEHRMTKEEMEVLIAKNKSVHEEIRKNARSLEVEAPSMDHVKKGLMVIAAPMPAEEA
jgi:hypothetical protein